MAEEKTRLSQLREMVTGAEERMLSASCSDQNFAVLGRLRSDLLGQIDELDPDAKTDRKKTGLSEFEKRLRERESSTKAPRKAKVK